MRLFGTDGIRGKANVYPLNPEFTAKIGKGIARFLSGNSKLFVLGGDTRISTPMISSSIASGILSFGIDLAVSDVVPSPVVAFLTRHLNADCGIVVSASHNPWEENGIKVFNRGGYKLSEMEEENLEEEIFKEIDPQTNSVGRIFLINDWMDLYISHLLERFDLDLSKMKIVIDCANGANFSLGKNVMEKFFGNPIVINDKPNGKNINIGGAADTDMIKDTVISQKADIGIAWDGDGDRVMLIDEVGNLVDGDAMIAIIAKDMKDNGCLKNNKIAVTEYSNSGLIKSMKDIGISATITGAGDRRVSEAMRKEGLNLGGEKSGHLVLFDYGTTGDGITTSLKVLEIMIKQKKKLSELNFFREVPQVLLNKSVRDKIPIEDMPNVLSIISRISDILGDEGRVYVRYSNTQNLVRVMVEGPQKDLIEAYANIILNEFK